MAQLSVNSALLLWLLLRPYLSVVRCTVSGGMLYAKDTETRETKELNGMWNFRADTSPSRNQGFDDRWYLQALSKTGPVIDMPVPSSYNDITQERELRDFVGWAWYDKQFFAPPSWKNQSQRVVLRFESAHYNTIVWLNSEEMVTHEGGHLPFEVEVGIKLHHGTANLITVAVNNTLTPHTIPPGEIKYATDTNRYPPGYFVQELQMDFFNYAGLQRPVKLYTTALTFIDDITVTTDFKESTGVVNYNISVQSTNKAANDFMILVELMDDQNQLVASSKNSTAGQLSVPQVKLWWPYGMSQTPAYLYTLKVSVFSNQGNDTYSFPVGIRTVKTTQTQFLINEKPFYFHGVGKHEDSDIRGKGLDFPLIAKDFNLLKWLGANSFRTSHYPYAEEIMDMCDKLGIVVIDECPAVGLKSNNYDSTTKAHHMEVMRELVRRDKNRPAVVMWSVANEPQSGDDSAGQYFKDVIALTRQLDPTRPVTFVSNTEYDKDKAAQYVDVCSINSYYGWYHDTGHCELIQMQLGYNIQQWHQAFNKPVIQMEYGAGAVSGIHMVPSMVFTEEFQIDVLQEHFKAFNELKKEYLVGEMVWNFADFMTDQDVKRVAGNKKGIFTRQRQPKSSAFVVREHYLSILNKTTKYNLTPKSSIPWEQTIKLEDQQDHTKHPI